MTHANLDPHAVQINAAWAKYSGGWGNLKPALKAVAKLCADADRLLKPKPKKALMEQLAFLKGEFSKLATIGDFWNDTTEPYLTGMVALNYEIATLRVPKGHTLLSSASEFKKAIDEGVLSADRPANGPALKAFKERVRGQKSKHRSSWPLLVVRLRHGLYAREDAEKVETVRELKEALRPIFEFARKHSKLLEVEDLYSKEESAYEKRQREAVGKVLKEAVEMNPKAKAKGMLPSMLEGLSDDMVSILLASVGIDYDELKVKAKAEIESPAHEIIAMREVLEMIARRGEPQNTLKEFLSDDDKAKTETESTVLDGFVAIPGEEIVGKDEPELPEASRKPSAARRAVAKAEKAKAKRGAQER